MTYPIRPTTEIAIVGMAGRFPAADSVDELWQLLLEGREAVRRLNSHELRAAGVPEALLSDPAYVPYGASVSAMKYFDAGFFGMTPAEAASTDPQHRLYMELAWRALEDASVPPGGNVGVFASTGYADYLVQNLIPAGDYLGGDIPYSVRIGNQADFLPSRLCHVLNLTGPSIAVQTACSSSLVAVDAACTALTLGRCDVAITGAVALRLPQPGGYVYADGGVWSKDGHCRPFDADASGWVAGNGGGVVVLKRLADAVADRDRIYAVIRGIGVNNDGADKTSFTAPSTSAQIAVINRAIADARIPTSGIGYIEAHGSGTPLGDPLEVMALAKAYTTAGGLAPGCGLGGIKANLGHMASAAGIASLIKTALVLHHQTIPPQINCSQPNPLLQLDRSGLVIYDRRHTPAAPLRAAAVTSLGMGGTNAHMILTAAETPDRHRPAPAEQDYLLPLSARSQTDLHECAEQLHHHLITHDIRIDDLAYTLTHGRARFSTTTVLRARTMNQAQEALRQCLDQPAAPSAPQDEELPEDALPHAVKIPLPGYPLHPELHWINPPSTDARASSTPQDPAGDRRPVGDLQDQVVEIFRTYLGRDDLGPDDDFDNVGGSSLTAVEIVDAIADRLGPAIGLGRFIQLRTPRRITQEIRTWVSGNLIDPALIQLREGTPGEEIFFIYPVNGTVFCYHKLIQSTTFAKPAYVLAYPFDDPNPPTTIADMAAKCIAEIQAVAPHGPYRLAGYSMGGNLAIEMAHQLGQIGETISDIVMIDPLPLYAYPRPAIELHYIRAAELTLSYFLNLPLRPSNAETVDDVVASLRQPTWSHRTEETTRRFVSTLVCNAMAITTAEQPPPVQADLTILAASDRNNPVYDLVGIKNYPPEIWQRHTTGKLTVLPIPGNHYTLYTEPENFTHLTTALDRIYG